MVPELAKVAAAVATLANNAGEVIPFPGKRLEKFCYSVQMEEMKDLSRLPAMNPGWCHSPGAKYEINNNNNSDRSTERQRLEVIVSQDARSIAFCVSRTASECADQKRNSIDLPFWFSAASEQSVIQHPSCFFHTTVSWDVLISVRCVDRSARIIVFGCQIPLALVGYGDGLIHVCFFSDWRQIGN